MHQQVYYKGYIKRSISKNYRNNAWRAQIDNKINEEIEGYPREVIDILRHTHY